MKHLMLKKSLLILLFICISLSVLYGKVEKVEITSREVILNGTTFGPYGAYEWIKGFMYFTLNPSNPVNHHITDLQLAPRNQKGLVEAKARFEVLKPVDVSSSSGIALVEVSNRGGKFSLRYFNRSGTSTYHPGDTSFFGNNLLMRKGLTVVWVGWEFDVPADTNILRLEVPFASTPEGNEIYGLVRSDWTIDEKTHVLTLGHRQQVGYPAANPESNKNMLTVRDGREAERKMVPRKKWEFAISKNDEMIPDPTHIYSKEGFEAGKIYELVYESKNPPVAGIGLAVIRDVISFIKYDASCPFPAKQGIAAGVSQTGRFLRHFLYQGFNTDEEDRKAYDGMMIMTAGAGRGSFNHRFAQPSRDAHRYSAFFYPTDIFPFTSMNTMDQETGISDGLLAHTGNKDHIPNIFYINTGYEYWGRAASLIHITPDAKNDVELHANERIYHIASGQHFVGRFPLTEKNKVEEPSIYRGDPLDFSVNYRALLIRLLEWVNNDTNPPASKYPTLKDRTLISPEKIHYSFLPSLQKPVYPHVAYRVDYGPRWEEGIITHQPPKIISSFPILIPAVNEYGNEMAGIQNVELQVPLATYLPWNLRTGFTGGQDEMTDFLGTFIPFPKNKIEGEHLQDRRPAIDQMYVSKEQFMELCRQSANSLSQEGFLLEEDIEYVIQRNEKYWDWIHSRQEK